MTENELQVLWEYYLIIDEDLANTARYVEPAGQENVFSFEFEKIIILACTEVEKLFKIIASESNNKDVGNIEQYKSFMMSHYPKIVNATVRASRLGKEIKPFENWDIGKLKWWDAYTTLKHHIDGNIKNATAINAIYSVGALYLLIIYLSKITNTTLYNHESKFIDSDYGYACLVANNIKELPDFE